MKRNRPKLGVITGAKMGRPKALSPDKVDHLLRLSVRYGNKRAAELSGVSLSTVERERRKVGLTDPNFVIDLLYDALKYDASHAAFRNRISTELVEEIISRY